MVCSLILVSRLGNTEKQAEAPILFVKVGAGPLPDSPTVYSVSLFLTARSRPRQTAGGQGQTARGGPQPPHPTADVSSSFLVFLRIASSGGLGGTFT